MIVHYWMFFAIFATTCQARRNDKVALTPKSSRDDKVLPVFQVVRFPNLPCLVSGGSKNGTCYTSEECANKGGSSIGTCAQGFGVCCVFTVGCGGQSSENCTYFEANSLQSGQCRMKICPCSSNICQMRLDFNMFTITGPSTATISTFLTLGGNSVGAGGKESNYATTCATDIFSVTNAPSLPSLCGTLTGDHVYFDAHEGCHDLGFALGQSGMDATIPSNRQVSIKITQLSCDNLNLAPQGCDQWFYGDSGMGYIKTFNYDTQPHLANQHQNICIRREAGNCKICYSADTITDVSLSNKVTKGFVKNSLCCAYGTSGKKTSGYDCLMIPGAIKATTKASPIPVTLCGGGKGLNSATGGASITVCSTSYPFRVDFISDGFEYMAEEAKAKTKGFKLKYYQVGC